MEQTKRTYIVKDLYPSDIVRIMGALSESERMHRMVAEGASPLDPPDYRAENLLTAEQCARIRNVIARARCEETRIP